MPGTGGINIIIYADDTVIYSSNDDPDIAVCNIQKAIDLLTNWCEVNKLTINENKTKFTTFLRKASANKYKTTCNKTELERSSTYKYLGTNIDCTLTMDTFNNNVCKKINYKLYMFGRIRKYINTYAATLIYKQTILPYFDYGSFLMNSAKQSTVSKVDKYQKRALRLIEYKPKPIRAKHLNVLLQEYRISSIRRRRDEQLLAFMYSISRNKDYIDSRRPLMTLRSTNKIKFTEKLTVKTLILKSPYNRGVILWNTLPASLQHAHTIKMFKKLLKTELLH